MTPSSPNFSPKLETIRLGEVVEKGVDSYADDIFTTPASLAGLPALSVPCGQDRAGLPIGLQVMGELAALHKLDACTVSNNLDWFCYREKNSPGRRVKK